MHCRAKSLVWRLYSLWADVWIFLSLWRSLPEDSPLVDAHHDKQKTCVCWRRHSPKTVAAAQLDFLQAAVPRDQKFYSSLEGGSFIIRTEVPKKCPTTWAKGSWGQASCLHPAWQGQSRRTRFSTRGAQPWHAGCADPTATAGVLAAEFMTEGG